MKKNVSLYLYNALIEKKTGILKEIESVQASANSDTKSSAGDKYETATAMAQNEIMMLQQQLVQIDNQLFEFSKIDFDHHSEQIRIGSLVHTSIGTLFISVAYGKIIFDQKNIMCLSAVSPLGKELLGKHKGQAIKINGQNVVINEVF